mmetsp:Transcript_48877/g.103932  ORF Transcript_48877/g.103932 Transcript_48877/m.103932 type:complete len:210 (+) Transcript_48877:657-1286(+)
MRRVRRRLRGPGEQAHDGARAGGLRRPPRADSQLQRANVRLGRGRHSPADPHSGRQEGEVQPAVRLRDREARGEEGQPPQHPRQHPRDDPRPRLAPDQPLPRPDRRAGAEVPRRDGHARPPRGAVWASLQRQEFCQLGLRAGRGSPAPDVQDDQQGLRREASPDVGRRGLRGYGGRAVREPRRRCGRAVHGVRSQSRMHAMCAMVRVLL